MIRLEFIETLCPHCRAFTAILNEVETRHMNRVNIVAVVNPPDLPANVLHSFATPSITRSCWTPTGSPSLCWQAGLPPPCLFLIDAAGQIRHQYEHGPATEKMFEREALLRALDNLLGASFGAPAADNR